MIFDILNKVKEKFNNDLKGTENPILHQGNGDIKQYNNINYSNNNINLSYQDIEEFATLLDKKLINLISQENINMDSIHSLSNCGERRITLEEKNIINNIQEYFESHIKKDIKYFETIHNSLREDINEDIKITFEIIIDNINAIVFSYDGNSMLNSRKIANIIHNLSKIEGDKYVRFNAVRIIHFMYYYCCIGKKE